MKIKFPIPKGQPFEGWPASNLSLTRPKDEDDACAWCKHWHAKTNLLGECRGAPPLYDEKLARRWPVTGCGDLCGSFERKL